MDIRDKYKLATVLAGPRSGTVTYKLTSPSSLHTDGTGILRLLSYMCRSCAHCRAPRQEASRRFGTLVYVWVSGFMRFVALANMVLK